MTSDFGPREDHKHRYDRTGRWIMARAVVAGWALAAVTRLPDVAWGFLFAFLAGGVVLNVLKEELPEERQSRFWLFFGGAAAYALVPGAICPTCVRLRIISGPGMLPMRSSRKGRHQ
ncbi:hypothetical protein [Rhodobacter sp. CZR27]|uniref:hypothetical protein n=1 Tax=Rhodobacter sp. CZR27 TaxID=2033869 RepID=UPI002FC9C384